MFISQWVEFYLHFELSNFFQVEPEQMSGASQDSASLESAPLKQKSMQFKVSTDIKFRLRNKNKILQIL
jgi:hypothetical protein